MVIGIAILVLPSFFVVVDPIAWLFAFVSALTLGLVGLGMAERSMQGGMSSFRRERGKRITVQLVAAFVIAVVGLLISIIRSP